MSKILVLGTGPLLEKGVRNFSAHCLRTWHLVKPLLDAGHDVALFTQPIESDRPETQVEHGIEDRQYEDFAYKAFRNCDEFHNLSEINDFADAFRPDALLGINSYPCKMLCGVRHRAPLWADLNGSVIIEAQVKSRVYGNNSLMGFYWEMEEAALKRSDRFSVVSMRQFYALHGELAAVGRLNRHTFDHPFATHIPNAYNPFFSDPADRDLGERSIRGGAKGPPEDAFIVLWSGGYNAWVELEPFMEALERAMEACPNLYYASTGGRIHGHDDLTYPKFEQMVRRSRFAKRFNLLGWIDPLDLPGIYAQADLGLCIDSRNFETMFGARNRTINMMAAGLGVLTCEGAEISDELIREGVAIGCKQDDPERLAEGLIAACQDADSIRELGEKGRQYVLEHFSYERTTRELVQWAEAPDFAPDNVAKLRRAPEGADAFSLATNPIEEEWARAHANGSSANGRVGGGASVSRRPSKRFVERVIGPERYAKLKFLRRDWMGHYLPQYRERQREIRRGQRGRLEDLYIFLTNACNARCKHCFYIDELGHVPGEMRLEDYKRLAPTLPHLDHITLTGGEAIMHPECREIIDVLGQATRAKKITLITNAFMPTKLEGMVASILEEHSIPGTLDILISIDGMEETHNTIRGNKRAWQYVNSSLGLLTKFRDRYPGRFDLGVITIVTDRNWGELEELNDHLRLHYNCRHGFEIIRGSDFSVWNLPEEVRVHFNPAGMSLPPREHWDEIEATLGRINRRSGISNHAFHLTTQFTFEMLRTGKKAMDCVSAGQNVGVLFPKGEIAMCEFSKSCANVRDYDMDFARAWASAESDAMREKLSGCHCTHGCYLSKNIEYTRRGQIAMLKDL